MATKEGSHLEDILHGQPSWLVVAEVSSIVFSVSALVNSIGLVVLHLRRNKHATMRKATVRILCMVPLYTVSATTSLWLYPFRLVRQSLEVLRMLYESVVIFSFLQLIVTCCGGVTYLLARFEAPNAPQESGSDDDTSSSTDSEDGEGSGPIACHGEQKRRPKMLPLCETYVPAWRSAAQMLRWCTAGALSYVVVGLCYGLFEAADFIWRGAYEGPPAWPMMIARWTAAGLVVVAQAVAMTSLLVLAVNVMEDLKPIRPKAKFFAVKAVVFFTFWQDCVLKVFMKLHLLDSLSAWGGFGGYRGVSPASLDEVQTVIQNLLICLEMCILSFLHPWIFPPEDHVTILTHQHAFYQQSSSSLGLLAPDPLEPSGPIINLGDVFVASKSLRREAKKHAARSSCACLGDDSDAEAER